MVKSLAILAGLVFIAIGIAGFIPGMIRNEILFGTFHVNVIHNVVHIVSGIIFTLAGSGSARAARLCFQIFGIIYAVLAIWGFAVEPRKILWVISNNRPDAWLHIVFAIIFLLLGFATSRKGEGA